MRNALIVVALAALVALSAFAQQPNPGFYGTWNTDVAKSKFGSTAPIKMHQVVIGPNGWVTAAVDLKDQLITWAVVTGPDGSCRLIGVPTSYSCEQTYPAPRRAIVKLTVQGSVVKTVDAELMPGGATITATDKMTTPGEPPNTSVYILTKATPPAPQAKKK